MWEAFVDFIWNDPFAKKKKNQQQQNNTNKQTKTKQSKI